MADCELLATCIFFNDRMESMPAVVEMQKNRFCRGDNSKCARYRVFKAVGREKVPKDLYPSQEERIAAIVYSG